MRHLLIACAVLVVLQTPSLLRAIRRWRQRESRPDPDRPILEERTASGRIRVVAYAESDTVRRVEVYEQRDDPAEPRWVRMASGPSFADRESLPRVMNEALHGAAGEPSAPTRPALHIPEDLADAIRARIRHLRSERDDSAAIDLAERLGALPLFLDMGGLYALRPSGAVVSVDWDARTPVAVEQDPRIIDVALAQGSRRYPELRALLPKRSDDAPACPHCNGTGTVATFANNPSLRETIICWCGGLGFIPPSWTPPRA